MTLPQVLTKVSAPSTPHGGPPQSCQTEPDTRRTPLRAVRPGGYAQVLRRPLARWCADLRLDERGALLWLLIEAHRRHWGRGGTPVLTISKTGMAAALGINRRRASLILDRLVDVGAIAWTPAAGGLDGELEVAAYDEVVADGRRELGTDYAALWCAEVDQALDDLGFDAWAVLTLAAVEVGSLTQTIVGPATGIAAHLGLSWYRLRPLVEALSAAGRIEWTRSATGARLRLLSYVDLVAAGTAAGDRGEVRVDAAGHALGREEAAQMRPRRPREARAAAPDDLENRAGQAPTTSKSARGGPRNLRAAPAVSLLSLDAHATRRTTSTTPPIARECSTPPEPTTKSRGGQGAHLRRVLVDREATMAVLNELAAYLDDPRGYGAALRVDLLADTAKAWELAGLIDDRLDAGWPPDELAYRLTTNLPDEFSNGSPTRLLAWRAADLPLQAPEVANEPVDEHAGHGAPVWVEVDGVDALVCPDCWEAPEDLRPEPFVVVDRPVDRTVREDQGDVDAAAPSYALPAVIEVEGRAPEPSAPDPDDASGRPGRDPSGPTSADPSGPPGGDPSPGDDLDPSPASTTDGPPALPGPAWARQAPPPAIEATPTGDRTSGPLEDAYGGGSEPSEAPPDLVAVPPPPDVAAALASLLRRPPADDEPRRAIERPSPAPMTPEQRARQNAEAGRRREERAARLRPLGLSA